MHAWKAWAWVPVLAAGLAACGDESDDDTAATDGGAEEVGTPTEGHWTSVYELVEDSCGIAEAMEDTAEIPVGGFTLTMTDDTHFTVEIDDADGAPTSPLSCTLAGTDFTCDPLSQDNPVDGVDATVVVTLQVSGSFPDWDTMSGAIVMSLECTGDDCGMVAKYGEFEFPCEATTSISATADG